MTKFRARGRTSGRKTGMNGTEAEYAVRLTNMLDGKGALAFRFERVTFKLADDTRFTPDFMVILTDGTIEFHEVKGWGFEDDAKVKIKVAAEMFPWFVFRSFTKRAKKDGGGWVERTY